MLLRQLQTSDHRFRAISALISAVTPEIMDRNTKLRTTSGTMISTSRVAHLVITNTAEIYYHKRKQNKWSKQIEFSAERKQFEKISKVGINEMYSNC